MRHDVHPSTVCGAAWGDDEVMGALSREGLKLLPHNRWITAWKNTPWGASARADLFTSLTTQDTRYALHLTSP